MPCISLLFLHDNPLFFSDYHANLIKALQTVPYVSVSMSAKPTTIISRHYANDNPHNLSTLIIQNKYQIISILSTRSIIVISILVFGSW